MPAPGDKIYLGSILCNVHCWGIVSDIDTPSGMIATFEVLGNDGAVTFDALVGPPGPPGQDAPPVKMQYASEIDDPADLPINLLDNDTDRGKAWWIGNQVHTWTGTGWMVRPMGTQGPPGPTPLLTATVELLDPEDPDLENEVVKSGTALQPNLHFKIKAPRGPAGPGWQYYDDDLPREIGDVPVYNGTQFVPTQLQFAVPKLYSVPEAAFTSFTGIATRQQIMTFALPPQEFDWTPMVIGHLRVVGAEADADPLVIGCEIRLGHPTSGEVIGRSFGNISTWSTVVPHYSTPQSSSDAITPDNDRAVVPANHVDPDGTLYMSVVNDGLFGTYNFNKKNAQLSVLVIPVNLTADGS